VLTCRDCFNLTSDFLNRNLPLRQRLAVRIHLLLCAGCRRYDSQMRTTLALLGRFGRNKGEISDNVARALFRSRRDP